MFNFKKKEIYIFCHVPKCAGTSFVESVKNHYSRQEIFLAYGTPGFEREDIAYSLLSLSEPERQNIKFIAGHHVYYGMHKFFGKKPKYFTFLRNPIDRAISNYNFAVTQFKTNNNKLIFPCVVDSNDQIIPYKEWLQKNRDLHNYFANFFYCQFMRKNEFSRAFIESDFPRLKKILKRFYFIGTAENYSEDCSNILKEMQICELPEKCNVSEKYIDPNDKSVKEWTSQFFKLDFKIYQYALDFKNGK